LFAGDFEGTAKEIERLIAAEPRRAVELYETFWRDAKRKPKNWTTRAAASISLRSNMFVVGYGPGRRETALGRTLSANPIMRRGKERAAESPDEVIVEVTGRSGGDDDSMRQFQRALQKHMRAPWQGSVIGEPVTVMRFNYDGNPRRALTVTCRRSDGREYEVAATEAVAPPETPGYEYLAAYRQWMGLDPYPAGATRTQGSGRAGGAALQVDLNGPVELVVVTVKQRAARCRVVGSGETITLRAGRLWDVVPGEVARILPHKQWSYARHAYLSGEIESTRVDVASLDLVPLRVESRGIWDPAEHYWGEEGEPIDEWARPIIARGKRPEFEMEQVLPGEDPDDPISDPILESNDRKDAGDYEGAFRILMELCQADLRCLDAHAHLGNLVFDHWPELARRHYEVGFRIGEWCLGQAFERFDGLLPWSWINNRPFLRCMNGFALCLWRLGRFEEAARIFERMLWLNPADNQGVRALIDDVRAKVTWRSAEEASRERDSR
jgi:tetratricopeptide (TPR) repeat protein